MSMTLEEFINATKLNASQNPGVLKFQNCVLEDRKKYNELHQQQRESMRKLKSNIEDVQRKKAELKSKIAGERDKKMAETWAAEKKLKAELDLVEAKNEITERKVSEQRNQLATLNDQIVTNEQKCEALVKTLRERAHIYKDITGICWDYDALSENKLKGYVQNKIQTKLQLFDLQLDQNKAETESKIWDVLHDANNKMSNLYRNRENWNFNSDQDGNTETK